MHWVTREHLHLDRVASPWLVLRFIDPDARFSFVPWGEEKSASPDAIPFALPGAELGPHDIDGSTFKKIMTKYALSDPALERLSQVIQSGIDFVLHETLPSINDLDGCIATGLVAIAEGMMLTNQSDDAILQASLPVYDALYANFMTQERVRIEGIVVPRGEDGRGPSAMVEVLRGVFANQAIIGQSPCRGGNQP